MRHYLKSKILPNSPQHIKMQNIHSDFHGANKNFGYVVQCAHQPKIYMEQIDLKLRFPNLQSNGLWTIFAKIQIYGSIF